MTVVWFAACHLGMLARGQAALREHETRLTGKPSFSSSGPDGCPEAWVDTDPKARRFTWPQSELPAGELPADTALTFTFLEPVFFTQGHLVLAKISTPDKVLYDASICRVHRETMHRTVVTPDAKPPHPAELTLFPNCGRIPKCTGQNQVTTWVCDSCRRERDRWLDQCRISPVSAAR